MPRRLIAVVFVSLVLAVSGSTAPHPRQIRVTSAAAFFAALGSDRTILFAPGEYLLDAQAGKAGASHRWETVFDGSEVVLHGLANLTLRGEPGVKILVSPRYAFVLSLSNVRNFAIENLELGHVEAGYCAGGVLRCVDSADVRIRNSRLFGSGTVGIEMINQQGFLCVDSTISECTYGLLSIKDSERIRFENTTFSKTGEYDLIEVSGTPELRFTGCRIRENWTGDFMPHLFLVGRGSRVMLENCKVENNRIVRFVNDPSRIIVRGGSFSGNSFRDRKD